MHRRLALAFSLAFTTVVTFGVIAVGAQIGVFSAGHSGASAQVAAPEPTNAPPPPPTQTPPTQGPPTAVVVTQYDYVDVPDAPPTKAAEPTVTPNLTSTAQATATAVAAPAQQDDSPPVSQPKAAPTSPPSAPTSAPPTHGDGTPTGSGGHDD